MEISLAIGLAIVFGTALWLSWCAVMGVITAVMNKQESNVKANVFAAIVCWSTLFLAHLVA